MSVSTVVYPGVSRILRETGLGFDPSGIDPQVLAAARDRGQTVHAAIEANHYGFDYALAPEYQPFMDAYARFVEETKHQPLVSEYQGVHAAWRYRWQLDRVGLLDLPNFVGYRTVIDFKSGGGGGVEVQLAAYALGWNAMHPATPVERAAAVELRRDGTYRVLPVDIRQPMAHGFTPEQVWLSCVVNFYARNGVS